MASGVKFDCSGELQAQLTFSQGSKVALGDFAAAALEAPPAGDALLPWALAGPQVTPSKLADSCTGLPTGSGTLLLSLVSTFWLLQSSWRTSRQPRRLSCCRKDMEPV